MNITSRGARAAARSLRQPFVRSSRRNASHGGDHGHGQAGHGESAFHVPGGTGNEAFGRSFYFVLAGVPLTYLTYALATSKGDNFISRSVNQFVARGETESERSAMNSIMMQQALEDRALFKTAKRDTAGPDHRFIEGLNAGSPINVAAGEGVADMDELVRYYKEKHDIMEEQRLANMRGGKVIPVFERSETPETKAKLYRGTK